LNNYSTFDFHFIGIDYFHMNHIHKALVCFNTCYYSHLGHSDWGGLITMKSSFGHLNCCSDIYYSSIKDYNIALVDIRVPAIQISFPASLKSSTHSAPVHCPATYLRFEDWVHSALGQNSLKCQWTLPMMAAAELVCLCYLMCSSYYLGRMLKAFAQSQMYFLYSETGL